MRKRGYTLIEILVTFSVLALLLMVSIFSVSRQRGKAEDARAKADLNRLKIAFEEYYNDHNCYPPAEWFDSESDCQSTVLSPYLANLTCDAKTDLPYTYTTDATGCKWFKLYTNIGKDDAQALAQCYPVSSTIGNYGVGSETVDIADNCLVVATPAPTAAPTTTPVPTATPAPTPKPKYTHYCRAGSCTAFDNTVWSCTPGYMDSTCGGSGCTSSGSCFLK